MPRLNGARILAALFVVYAAVGGAMLAVMVPPFCNADETAHFLRADQVASGVMVAARPGGLVDPGISEASRVFDGVRDHPGVKVSPAMLLQAGRIGWGGAIDGGFPNTALYPPTGYFPAAAAIRAGQHLGWPIARTLIAARLVNAAVCIAVCAVAIALSGGMAVALFTILCLPMSLALFASVSQDWALIAAAALAVAALGRGARGWWLLVVCACLCVLAMSRPPYLALAVVLLTPAAWRGLGAVFVLAAVLIWSCCVGPVAAAIVRPGGIDPAGQIAWLLRHPALLYQVPIVVLVHQWADGLPYARQFIGVLGSLDVALPGAYIGAAWGAIGLALMQAQGAALSMRGRLSVLGAILASGAALFAVQYLTWTEIGSHLVEGVQGRYFLPLALFGPLVLPRAGAPARLAYLAYVPVAAFPVLSIAIAVHAVVHRYYL